MPSRTFDNLLLLKDAGAITVDAGGTVASVARIVDVGDAHMDGVAVVDIGAIDTANGTYVLRVQGSTTIGFGTPVELAARAITATGRTEIPFNNEAGGLYYRYVRCFNDVSGATPSINGTVFIGKP
jgi:hypothetical protein